MSNDGNMTSRGSQLRAEIGFWKELINHPDRPPAGKALERMQQALALAERKLHMLAPQGRSTVVELTSRRQPPRREES